MNNMSFWSILPWAVLTLGFLVTILAYARFEEIGRMVGAGAGLIVCSVVFLAGINGTALGALLFTGGAVLVGLSGYVFGRERRRRGKDGPLA